MSSENSTLSRSRHVDENGGRENRMLGDTIMGMLQKLLGSRSRREHGGKRARNTRRTIAMEALEKREVFAVGIGFEQMVANDPQQVAN